MLQRQIPNLQWSDNRTSAAQPREYLSAFQKIENHYVSDI